MSFLLDPALLVASGAAIERLAGDQRTADRLAGATLTGFLAVSGTLWSDTDVPALRPLWRPFGSRGPRDFMVNSGLLRVPVPRRASARHHLAAAAIFATYPAFLTLGRRLARHRAPAGYAQSADEHTTSLGNEAAPPSDPPASPDPPGPASTAGGPRR